MTHPKINLSRVSLFFDPEAYARSASFFSDFHQQFRDLLKFGFNVVPIQSDVI